MTYEDLKRVDEAVREEIRKLDKENDKTQSASVPSESAPSEEKEEGEERD